MLRTIEQAATRLVCRFVPLPVLRRPASCSKQSSSEATRSVRNSKLHSTGQGPLADRRGVHFDAADLHEATAPIFGPRWSMRLGFLEPRRS